MFQSIPPTIFLPHSKNLKLRQEFIIKNRFPSDQLKLYSNRLLKQVASKCRPLQLQLRNSFKQNHTLEVYTEVALMKTRIQTNCYEQHVCCQELNIIQPGIIPHLSIKKIKIKIIPVSMNF